MCIGVPGRILETSGGDLPFGKVSFGGVVKDVNLALVPEAGVGAYVLVNMGTAVHTLDEAEANEVMALLEAYADSLEARPERAVGTAGRA